MGIPLLIELLRNKMKERLIGLKSWGRTKSILGKIAIFKGNPDDLGGMTISVNSIVRECDSKMKTEFIEGIIQLKHRH